jgi:hypothetical protein
VPSSGRHVGPAVRAIVAAVLESHPAAMQLRTLSTMVEVAAEKNSTLIFPIPVELVRLAEALTARTGGPAT